MNLERMQALLKAVEDAQLDPDHQEHFTMEAWGTDCGSPCCIAGHYAARTDLQDAFVLDNRGTLKKTKDGELEYAGVGNLAEHFDLSIKQAKALFDINGCGSPHTLEEAADFIHNFIQENK